MRTRSEKKSVRVVMGFMLFLLTCCFATAATSGDEKPYVGFETQLFAGQSKIFDMSDCTAIQVQFTKIQTSGVGSAMLDFEGTGDDNITYTTKKTLEVYDYGIGFNSQLFWSKPANPTNNDPPNVRYTCTKNGFTMKVTKVSN